jgi:hypothetical protein
MQSAMLISLEVVWIPRFSQRNSAQPAGQRCMGELAWLLRLF